MLCIHIYIAWDCAVYIEDVMNSSSPSFSTYNYLLRHIVIIHIIYYPQLLCTAETTFVRMYPISATNDVYLELTALVNPNNIKK